MEMEMRRLHQEISRKTFGFKNGPGEEESPKTRGQKQGRRDFYRSSSQIEEFEI